jgi:lipoprotein-anchoring transpeptidase ErfK/SrfK
LSGRAQRLAVATAAAAVLVYTCTGTAARASIPSPGQEVAPRPAHRADRFAAPWRRDGTSRVAQIRVRVKHLRVFRHPHARRPFAVLPNPNRRGTPLVLLVRARRHGWLHVYLPVRPNGTSGWIRARSARVLRDHYRVIVRVRRHRLEVWRGRRLVTRQRVAVGRRRMPTPHGVFFVVELLKPTNPRGTYGPFSFGLSAHSNVLRRFGGGDGRIGMHGTNEPWLLGHSISHGCIRMPNRAVRKLARLLPLGTPVVIRS